MTTQPLTKNGGGVMLEEEYLPPQVVRRARDRYYNEYMEAAGPWMAKVPTYQIILDEEHERWKQQRNLNGN